jgi:hypothetical protein
MTVSAASGSRGGAGVAEEEEEEELKIDEGCVPLPFPRPLWWFVRNFRHVSACACLCLCRVCVCACACALVQRRQARRFCYIFSLILLCMCPHSAVYAETTSTSIGSAYVFSIRNQSETQSKPLTTSSKPPLQIRGTSMYYPYK